MPVLEKLNIGIVGAAGRGASFSAALEANGARLQAVCDLNREKLEENPAFTAAEKYSEYENMLEHAALDAVIVGTPQQLHAAQAGQALERGLHVLSEVPAAVSIEEARRLVQAASAARSIYMLAENYNYFKGNILVRELARQGLFGEVYYAEGEYLHNVRSYIPRTPWRRHWQMGIDGNTYPTHELGPILSWMPGDRVARLACEGSGRHYTDGDGQALHQDTSLMVCKTARGALIKIRLDLVSERPESVRFQLQGTHGVYESEPWGGGFDRIWLRGLSQQVKWLEAAALAQIDTLAEKYLPDWWRHPPEAALKAGHDGGDFFVLMDFLAAARGEQPSPLDIHAAMDMTLPGLVSQQSIAQEGAWLDVPDSRVWVGQPLPTGQLQMVLSAEALAGRDLPPVASGYRLRQCRPEDEAGYYALMTRAGFDGWMAERMGKVLPTVLPGGFFVIEHLASGQVAASALAQHVPTELHPFGGQLGWVATDPDHRGRKLGTLVTAAATRRLVEAGYRRIYLLTDDFRLPAIRIYLALGYTPLYHAPDMQHRWQSVLRLLGQG